MWKTDERDEPAPPRVDEGNGQAPPNGVVPARPSRQQAEEAVRTLLSYVGEDPTREGLLDTPARYVRAFDEFCRGYGQDAEEVLARTFSEVGTYRDFVLVRDIRLTSHCEHHLQPIRGRAHVAYVPEGRVVGLSKLARLVEVYARRLQVQERLTVEIAEALQRVVKPRGVAVILDAEHLCMSIRGVQEHEASTVTRHFTGCFLDDRALRGEFLERVRQGL